MTQYKVITTLTWKFESHQSPQHCLQYAKEQLDGLLNTEPNGEDFEGFTIQVDLAQMKERKRLIHLGEFSLDEVFPFITVEDSKREFTAGSKRYLVRMNSDRYHVFKANPACVACGLVGTKLFLDLNPGDSSPHFNLYAEEHGRLILMTKDHILAKSKGGSDEMENFTTCCSVCNNLKGNFDLTYDDVRELRRIWNNSSKLTRKELKSLINRTRDEMAAKRYVAAENSHNGYISVGDLLVSEVVYDNGPRDSSTSNGSSGSETQ